MLVEALKKAFLVGFSNDHRDLLTPPWRTWVATTRGLIKKTRQGLESSIFDVGPDLVSKHAVCSCFNTLVSCCKAKLYPLVN